MDARRVVEVFATDPDKAGSGYLVADHLILTAHHVVDGAATVHVRPLGTTDWLPATIDWSGCQDLDAALLGVAVCLPPGTVAALWGELRGSEQVGCTAVGFPDSQARRQGTVVFRDTEQLFGQVAPLTNVEARTHAITVTSSSPLPTEPGTTPWAGMSGAALFAGPYLVGVVRHHPGAHGQDRLVATPIGRLLEDEGFRRQLVAAGASETDLEAIDVGARFRVEVATDLSFVLGPPVWPLPAGYSLADGPGRLLWAEHGLVPFLGREAELAKLLVWCDGQRRLSVRVLLGRGGTGKSRLAAEACIAMRKRGWDGGPVDFSAPGGDNTRLQLERSTLLVLDDADLQIGRAAQLITHFDRNHSAPTTRVLLIARSASAWFTELRQACPAVDGWLEPPLDRDGWLEPPLDLDAASVASLDRTTQFTAAARVFAPLLDRPLPASPWLPLDDPDFDTPLLVHANALLSSLEEPPSTCGSTSGARDKVLGRLVLREQQRWKATRPAQVDAEVAARGVAVATLAGANRDESQYRRLLRALEELSPSERGALARWLARRVDPLRPDLLASAHLAGILRDVPELPAAVYDVAEPPERIRVLTTLARLALDEPGTLPLVVEHFLDPRLENLVAEARLDASFSALFAELVGHLAWRAAEDADRSAVAAGGWAQLLANELRWALTIASVGTRVLPTALLRELALTGVWTADQALGYARLNRSAPDRAEALASLASALPEPLRGEARREALATAEGLVAAGLEPAAVRRVAVLAGLIPLLPLELDLRRRAARAALGNARQLSDERRVASGYTGYYASEFGELFAHTGYRSAALDQIAAALPRAGWPDDEIAELRLELERVCGEPDDAAFNEATTGLLARLTDAQPPQAESARPEAGDAVTRARLADVRRQLAEAVSQPINDADVRTATAAALAENRPFTPSVVDVESTTGEGAPGVVLSAWPTAALDDPAGQLFELIRTAPSLFGASDAGAMEAPYQAAVLAALAGHLPDEVMTKALEFAERISEPAAQYRAVRALGPFLTESALRSVVARIQPDRRDAADRLAPLVDFLPGTLLLDALTAVRRINDDDARAAGLAVLVSHLPERQASEVTSLLAERLTTADAANPAGRDALTTTARYLPASLAAHSFAALRAAALPADASSRPDPRVATAILALARCLPEPDRTEALRLIQTWADHSTWSTRSWGSADAQARIVGALDLGRELPPSPERDQILRTLANEAIDEARTASYGRGYATWNLRYRIGLFIVLLPHLPDPHLSEAAEMVLRMIVDKSPEPLPVDQTASLAAYLPAQLLPAAERAITAVPLPLFLPEESLQAALDTARQRSNIDWLFAVANRGLLAECLTVAEEIGGPLLRIELITHHARRLATIPPTELHDVWTATLHGLAGLDRPRFLGYLRYLGPIITALSGPDGVTAVGDAIEVVATIWP